MQALVLTRRPFGEQDCPGIFPAEKGTQSLFEGAAEQHRGPGVLLLPAIEIAVPIPPRAGEVLADLGVAVGHSGYLWAVQICRRKLLPTICRSKTVEAE